MSDNAQSHSVGFAPQLLPEQLVQVKEQGFVSVINNRPDHEDPTQPLQADIEKAAQAQGLAYAYVPVISGAMTQANIEDFAKAYNQLEKPVLMFCRSGSRSNVLFNAAVEQKLIDAN